MFDTMYRLFYVRPIFPLFLIGLRQAKVVNGIHRNRCIRGGIIV